MPLGMRLRHDVRTVTTMAPLQLSLKLVLLLLVCCTVLVEGSHNVTVDDDDTSQIIYDPPDSWRETPFDPLNAGGSHRVTSDTDATATFTFTGTAIYFYAPLWPFEVTTAVSLDGAPPVTIGLMDPATVIPEEDAPETVQSQVVWSADGLDNIEHTLVVSVAQGDDHAVVDTVVYTVLDAGDPTPTTSTDDGTPSTSLVTSSSSFSLLPPPTPTPSPISSNASSPTAHKGLSIALGIVCTVFALLVFYGIYWYWRRRQRLRLEQQEEEEYARNNPSSPSQDVPSMGYAYRKQPAAWQRNSRGRLVAVSTGITTTDTLDHRMGTNGAVRGAGAGTGRRPRPAPPRRHGPSPLSMSSSASSSSVTSSGGLPKKPLKTIPEMRIREDVDLDASPSSVKPPETLDARTPRAGAVSDSGSTKWTTFDDQSES